MGESILTGCEFNQAQCLATIANTSLTMPSESFTASVRPSIAFLHMYSSNSLAVCLTSARQKGSIR